MPYKDAKKRYEAIQKSRAKKPELYKMLDRKKEKARERRGYFLQRYYGIGWDDYNAMLVKQQGLCAICKEEADGMGRLHVDHDHKTGKVRGLLCFSCNVLLGRLENEELMEKFRSYLEDNS